MSSLSWEETKEIAFNELKVFETLDFTFLTHPFRQSAEHPAFLKGEPGRVNIERDINVDD